MDMISKIENMISKAGFYEFGYVDIEKLNYYPEVRQICEGNQCRKYGTTWVCPPAVGTIEECRARVNQYDKMLIFTQMYELEDSFDFEGMVEGMQDFKQLVDRLQQNLNESINDYQLFSSEGCDRCTSCTYPDAPCRFPELIHHSLEGYGFIVSELAKEAGIRYHNGPNTVTYFGALLFNLK